MGMSVSGRRAGVSKRIAGCLAGMMALAATGASAATEPVRDTAPTDGSTILLPAYAAADDAPAVRFMAPPDSGPNTMPAASDSTGAPTTRPAPAPFFLPGPTAPPESARETTADGNLGTIVRGEEYQHGPLTYSLTGLFLYGSAGGAAQTPLGSALGTTNVQRPKLNSIGIDDAHIGDGEFAVGLDNQQIFFGVQHIHESGNSVLERALVSDAVTFPKRTRVHSDMRFDWYRLGYRYTFVLDTAPNGVPDVTLTPWIEGLYWDYGYSLNGGRVGTAGRSLQKLGVQLGASFAWRPDGGPLSLEASAGSFPKTSTLVDISVETLLARYRLYRWRDCDFNFLLGVEFEQQDFQDRLRPVGNHVTAEFGPMVVTGLQMNF